MQRAFFGAPFLKDDSFICSMIFLEISRENECTWYWECFIYRYVVCARIHNIDQFERCLFEPNFRKVHFYFQIPSFSRDFSKLFLWRSIYWPFSRKKIHYLNILIFWKLKVMDWLNLPRLVPLLTPTIYLLDVLELLY